MKSSKGAGEATSFAERVQSHWTDERTAKVTGGKRYPLLPAEAPELLRELGLLNRDASMPADAVRKYGQVNHLLLQLAPHLEALSAGLPTIRVLDAGAGKSYLSFLLAWAFERLWKKPVEILGVDTHARLMADATARSERLGLADRLRFTESSVAELDWQTVHTQAFPAAQEVSASGKSLRPHVTLALHACDTATDDALALAVRLKSDFIAVAPCCQAELARRWKDLGKGDGPAGHAHPLAPLFHAPELRREVAADITDLLRVLLLRSRGYEVTTTEFVSAEHTPKNRLILATRRGRYLDSARGEYERLKEHLGGAAIKLEALLAAIAS